jgi:hypothetical protein
MESATRGKIPYAKPIAIALALFVIYVLLGFFAAPPLVRHLAAGFVEKTLQRKADIGDIRVNPLLLTLEIRDFAIAEQDGAPIAGFKRLFADFQASSLFRRAWTFADIALDSPELRADIAPDGRFNIKALLDDLPKPEDKRHGALPRMLLQRVNVGAGVFSFHDRSLQTPASTVLSPISLEVHDLSSIPDSLGNYALSVRLPEGGTLGWKGEASLQPLTSRGSLEVKGAKLATVWKFLHDNLGISEPAGELDASLRYDFSYAGGATKLAADSYRIEARGIALATGGEKGVALALAKLALTGGATFEAATGKPWTAQLASAKAEIEGLDFTDRSRATPYNAVAKAVSVGFNAAVEASKEGSQARLDEMLVAIAELSAGPPGAAPMFKLEKISVEGGKVDVSGRQISLGKLAIAGGELGLVREKDGSLPLLRILAPSDEGLLRREIGAAKKEAKAEGKPWRTALEELRVEGVRIALSDHSFGAPIAYGVRDLRFTAHGYASDGAKPVKLEAALTLEQGGSLTASGEASVGGDRAELRAKLERVNLKPLQPVIASRARVTLVSADAFADVKVSYRRQGDKLGLRLGGTVRLDNLLVNEASSGERLVAWKSLSASGLSLGFEPNLLRIGEARVQGLDAKVVVFQDRSTNLARAMVVQEADASANKAQVKTADTEVLFPIAVDRVRLENGDVDFADLSLVLPFGTKVNQLAGLIEGISNDRQSRATLKVEGRVDEYGLARAEGTVKPFHPTDFMDITVLFRNVDMPPLSPYSATFAGRRIASGKLSLDLRYKIEQGKLAGDNRVVLEKFTLGEKVNSPSALDLPLDLAVALLTDSDGRIDLAVPVSGDVNDPKFDYGAVVWQAVKIVLTKIVTAPFRALASLFGGSGEENLESVAFDAGRAALLPPEQEKLKRVSEMLAKRPQLKLVAEGQTGPADRAALQQRDVVLAVDAKLGRPAPPPGAIDTVNVTDAKTQRALEALFVERNSDEALDRFAAEAGKARGKPVDRVNAALALVGRGSSDREFYEALLKRLNETAKLPDTALPQLADERAKAVTAHLTTKLSVPADRASARVAKAPGTAQQVKLELDATPVK